VKTLSWLLEESGYRTAAALSGQAACEILESTAPDLAIVDVNLPDVHGLSVAAEICRRAPNCRVLLLSGETTAEVRRAIENGLNADVLEKPVPPSDLLVKIRSILSNEKGTFGDSDGQETEPKK
jgi:DNA-binding response OmpR family regulator